MRNVENSLPTPPKTPDPSKKLPDFETFVQEMKPLLTLVQRHDLATLLECLYEAAKTKMEFEDYRNWARDNAASMRKIQDSMVAVSQPLRKALRVLEKTKEDNHAKLEQIESWAKGAATEPLLFEVASNLR